MEIKINSNKTNRKIGKVLQKLLEPSFKVGNDVYLNQFLNHLVGQNDDKLRPENKQLQEEFCQWIIKASNLWDDCKVIPNATVFTFALNIASQLSADEQIFVRLNCQNVYEGLVELAQTNSKSDPCVALGLVTLLCSFLDHKSGLQWVLATTYWCTVVNLGLIAHSMDRKQAYQFVIKLLEKTVSYNRNFAVNLVDTLIKPLKDIFRSLPNSSPSQPMETENMELFQSIRPSLDMILETVETLLKRNNKKVMELFLKLDLSETIEKALALSRIEDFSYALHQIQFVLLFYHICERLDGVKMVSHNSLMLYEIKMIFDVIRIEMENWNVRSVIKMCDYAHGLFCYLAPRMPAFIKKGIVVEFQTEMMCLQIGPIYAFTDQLLDEKEAVAMWHEDAFRREYFKTWMRISTFQTIYLSYKWEEILCNKPDLVDDSLFCLQYVKKMKMLLNKERAALLLSALIYSLIDTLIFLKQNPIYQPSLSFMMFTKALVDAIIDLIDSFDLNWKDSIETICVMDLAYDYLQYTDNWDDEIVVISGLKLLNTAISKYMSPDMVLLIYNTEDSKVSQTGTLLYDKCHDIFWKIRDSALEIIYTLSLNANSKFPEYTSILLNADLPQLVVHMALKDYESKVRATAFNCLQELIQIPDIWDTLLNMGTFLDDILDAFERETEGIVRKGVAILIFKIHKVQSFPEDTLPRVYDVMTHAAIADRHWEVKYNALDFWFNLWEQHLTHEGMIDHTFPSHTFSKELKKIVALNETEVRKRIVKVLNQLSHIGCLHVMKCAVEDDCDIQVSKKATSFTFSMLRMFKIYKITADNVDRSQLVTSYAVIDPVNRRSLQDGHAVSKEKVSVQDTVPEYVMPLSDISTNQITSSVMLDNEMDVFDYDGITCDSKIAVSPCSFEPVETDVVLNKLLNSKNMTVPQGTYNPREQLQITNKTTQMKTKTYVAPSQYLKFVYNEVERLAMEKSQYVNSFDEFDSLLNDILKEYNLLADENGLDCY